jgi:3-hydroxyisobutyrate dehydrogenase
MEILVSKAVEKSDKDAVIEKPEGVKIAYLGLGLMGEAMAVNLSRAGLDVVGWNRTPGKSGEAALLAAGGKVEKALKDAVSGAGVVFTCLGDIEDVEQVLIKAGGVIECAAPGTVIADFSTIGPEAAKRIFDILNGSGLHFLDAPVTGGDVGARNATLTVMVGGDEEPFQKALPLLKKIGKTIKRCGPSGSGQALKLCNQILCAVNMISVCEAFHLAKQLGVDENLVVEVLSAGAGGSWALTNLGPRIIKSDFAPGFALKHMLKDLRLVFENLDGESDQLPGTKLAQALFKQVGENDGSASGGADGARGTQAMSLAYE